MRLRQLAFYIGAGGTIIVGEGLSVIVKTQRMDRNVLFRALSSDFHGPDARGWGRLFLHCFPVRQGRWSGEDGGGGRAEGVK